MIEKVKTTLNQHGRHIWLAALLAGFIFDFLTLWRIDLWQEDLIFIVYLSLAGASIAFMSLYEAGLIKLEAASRLRLLSLLALQFTFGGLFGRFFIFYSRSGALVNSWPFLIFIALLFVGNEVLRKRYSIFTFRMVVYFIVLFSFAIFYVPIITGNIGAFSFVVSGIASLAIVGVFSFLLLRRLRGKLGVSTPKFAASILGVYALISLMYYANLIPPLPLSMQEAGMFYKVTKTASGYVGTREVEPWYARLRTYQIVHIKAGDTLYAFSSVFAPTSVRTTVVHRWQYYDPKVGRWVVSSLASFDIVGGRDGGYRGYSTNSTVTAGDWRVDVLTLRGDIIGRIQFKAVVGTTSPTTMAQDLL